jgi:hypothetical protein
VPGLKGDKGDPGTEGFISMFVKESKSAEVTLSGGALSGVWYLLTAAFSMENDTSRDIFPLCSLALSTDHLSYQPFVSASLTVPGVAPSSLFGSVENATLLYPINVPPNAVAYVKVSCSAWDPFLRSATIMAIKVGNDPRQ